MAEPCLSGTYPTRDIRTRKHQRPLRFEALPDGVVALKVFAPIPPLPLSDHIQIKPLTKTLDIFSSLFPTSLPSQFLNPPHNASTNLARDRLFLRLRRSFRAPHPRPRRPRHSHRSPSRHQALPSERHRSIDPRPRRDLTASRDRRQDRRSDENPRRRDRRFGEQCRIHAEWIR